MTAGASCVRVVSRLVLPCVLLFVALGCATRRLPLPAPTPVKAEVAAAASRDHSVVIRTQEMGELRTVLHVTMEDTGALHASSRSGAVGDVLGMWRGWLARSFTDSFPGGSLVSLDASATAHWSEGAIPLTGFFTTPVGRLAFDGRLQNGQLFGELRSRRGAFGEIEPMPWDAQKPIDDYPQVVRRAKAMTAARIFDPRTQGASEWKAFWSKVEGRAALAQDDLEVVFGFFDAASKLGVSHFSLIRNPAAASGEGGAKPGVAVELSNAAPGVALLKCNHFQDASAQIDAAFDSLARDTRSLIVDLRGCPGGDVSSMRVAAHLLKEPADAGVFLGAGWWASHERVPSSEELAGLPLLEKVDQKAFFEVLAKDGALRGRVLPTGSAFSGAVYVLIDGNTASAAEPLAAMLRDSGRAKLIGETTAGAMLSSEAVDVGDGWVLRLPTADYYTAAGVRLEGRGVEPHREVKAEQALAAALEEIR